MSYDGLVWATIGERGFCSFRVVAPPTKFCLHKYSLNGLCAEDVCPLAHSRYATVLDVNGRLVLCRKAIERAHQPSRLWEYTELPPEPREASRALRRALAYWPRDMRDLCRLRLKKLMEVRLRKARLERLIEPRVVAARKKAERRDRARQAKALAAAQIEKVVQREILAQLEKEERVIANSVTGAHRLARKAGASLPDIEEAEKAASALPDPVLDEREEEREDRPVRERVSV